MSEQQPCSSADSTCPDKIEQELENFKSIRSPVMRWTLYLLPPGIFITILFIISYYDMHAGRVMYITGLFTAAMSLIAFRILMRKIPETFAIIWDRKVIIDCRRNSGPEGKLGSVPDEHNESSVDVQEELEREYLAFIQRLEGRINSPFQILSGIVFSLFVLTWNYSSVAEFFIAFVIGIMAWKMAVTAVYVWKMGKDFCFEPQLGHADRCGGLSPLGDLCLWNAIIVTIPAVYLGSWIIIGMITEPQSSYFLKSAEYASLFSELLFVPVFFALIAFFLPLWSTHQLMLKWREKKRSQMDHLEQCINKLECRILEEADSMDEKEYGSVFRERELMEKVYRQHRTIPVWPFNISIITRFLLSQSIPVFGIASQVLNFIRHMP